VLKVWKDASASATWSGNLPQEASYKTPYAFVGTSIHNGYAYLPMDDKPFLSSTKCPWQGSRVVDVVVFLAFIWLNAHYYNKIAEYRETPGSVLLCCWDRKCETRKMTYFWHNKNLHCARLKDISTMPLSCLLSTLW
jgi:hypothetical protein